MPTILGSAAISLPAGTTDNRPAGSDNHLRFNTSTNKLESFNTNSSAWNNISPRYDGSSMALAVPHARFLIAQGITTNDYYWILVNGTPKNVYCDLVNGGWMYLTPPIGATDDNPFGITFNVSGSNVLGGASIQTKTDVGTWKIRGDYTAGTTTYYTRFNTAWTNNISATEVRFVAAQTGISQSLTVNGTGYGANRSNSYNSYWSDSSPTCSGNTCYNTSTHWNSATPRTYQINGNLTITQIAYSQGDTHGGTTWIGNISVR